MYVLLRLVINLLRLVTWPVWGPLRRLRRRRARWVKLRLKGSMTELQTPRAAWMRSLVAGLRTPSTAVSSVRRLCEAIAEDPQVEGLLLEIGSLDAGWATLASLRSELSRLRAAQKRVVAFLPAGASQRELFVASVAERVLTPPASSMSALGPMATRLYLATLLEKLGVRVEVLAQGNYKTAAEPLVRTSMSESEREQLSAIVDTLHESWVSAVAERPRLGEAGAGGLLEQGFLGVPEARERGLVDDACYEDELEPALGLGEKEHPMSARRYGTRKAKPLWQPLKPPSRVAIVRLEGAISEHPTARGIGLSNTTAVLRALAETDEVPGVILYIDSPGGSAVVSDLLHREVQRLNERKPVVAWLGNVAASGGYYLAAAARHIVAQPTTLTGSIGVIAVRPVATALFDKLGVREEVVKLSPHADIHSITRELDDHEKQLLMAETHRFYQRFLEVVAQGRKRSAGDIEPLAGGRVWTGRDALAQGLVDGLGGYREARAALDRLLAERGQYADPRPAIVSLPMREVTPPPPTRKAAELLGALTPRAAPAIELLELARGGHAVLAYAHELPTL